MIVGRCYGHGRAAVPTITDAEQWVSGQPAQGTPGYAPLAAGMATALLHVDDFVEGHSLAALERLAAVVGGAARAPRNGATRA